MSAPPPRPGDNPCWPLPFDHSPGVLAAWEGYCAASHAYWGWLADEVTRQVPGYGLEYIGGGYVICAIYEDRSYAWLGGLAEDDGDGPYAFGPPNFVGGYRYDADSSGERFTDRLVVPTPDPDDPHGVAGALADVARELWAMPFTQSV